MVFGSEELKARALALGFNLVGVTRAEPSPYLNAYFRWVEAAMHGTMDYMARADRQQRRRDLNAILPGVRSLVVVGLDYHTGVIPEEVLSDPSRGRIASYAWGLDYHHVMTPRLETLAQWLCDARGNGVAHKVYVDTGAILERSHGHEAGLGFTGKNTMLIHPRRGSSFFLGEILTDLEFDEYDISGRQTMCGTCTRCMVACPTDAFPRPFVLDARRCISYLTIEHKGWIDPALRPLMGNWVFGCDICQDVCPFERYNSPTHEQTFYPANLERAAPKLLDLLSTDDSRFKAQFGGSAIERVNRERLVRNACIAAGNWRHVDAIPILKDLLEDTSALVRGHAAWAMGQILGKSAKSLLAGRWAREEDALVKAEIASVMG